MRVTNNVKVAVFDSPVYHGLDVNSSAGFDVLVILPTERPNPDRIAGRDVLLAHATDDARSGGWITAAACSLRIPVILYSGDVDESSARADQLRLSFPDATVSVATPASLVRRVSRSRNGRDARLLFGDPRASVLDALTELWMVGLVWERDGNVWGRVSDGAVGIVTTKTERDVDLTPVIPDGRISAQILGRLTIGPHETVESLREELEDIFGNPEVRLRVLSANTPAEYFDALAKLRDAWLDWVASRD